MKKNATTITVGIVIVVMTGLVWGQGLREGADFGGHPPGGRPNRGAKRAEGGHRGKQLQFLVGRILDNSELREELGISEEQVQSLRANSYELRTEGVDLRAELEKAGMRQAHLMTEPEIDEDALMKAVEQAGEIRTALAKLRIRQLLLVKRTFTPEQMELARKRMREHVMKARGTRGERRHRDRPEHARSGPPPEEEEPGVAP